MDSSPSPRRRYSGDQSRRKHRDFSNGYFEGTSSSIRQSPERDFRPFYRVNNQNEKGFDVSYGGEPISAHSASWEAQYAPESNDTGNTSSRTLFSPIGGNIAERNISNVPSFVEGIENDGTKAEEVEEAGLSWTVTLPTNTEQNMLYTNLTDANSVWKVEKSYDKKIGTTSLQSIYSIKYSIGEMGQGKVTLFCPQGPIRDDEDLALVQAKWLHVQRSSMSVKVLEKLVMDCPIINEDIRRVAILLLEAVEKSFLRESENGAYIEPGSVLRFSGTRHMLHDSHDFVATEPVVFAAFPFVELTSSKNNHGSHERDEFYPRTLLQNLYGFDIVTSRGKHQVIHKMPVGSQPNDTLIVNQLWCLVIGSDILITISDRPADHLLGDTIEKRADYFRQPLRIEIVDRNGLQHSMSISAKTPWVDFFRHVILTAHGNLINIMDYELVDLADEVVTAERWVGFAKATKPSLLKFYLVEKRGPTSRSSSVSSRRSSHLGIKRLLLLDYAHRDHRYSSGASLPLHNESIYDGNSSSSERILVSKRASTPGRPRYPSSSTDYSQPTESKGQTSEARVGIYSETDTSSLYPQYTPTIITLDSSDENYSETERMPPILRDSQDVGDNSEGTKSYQKDDMSSQRVSTPPDNQQSPSSADVDEDIRDAGFLSVNDHSSMHKQQSPANNIEHKREDIIPLEDNFSYLDGYDQNETSKEEATDVPMVEDIISSSKNSSIKRGDDGLSEHKETSTTQPKKPSTTYQKVQIEDGSESSDEDNIESRTHGDPIPATLPDATTEFASNNNSVFKGEKNNSSPVTLPMFGDRENMPEKRYTIRNSTSFPQTTSSGRFRSRSSSLSSSTDDSSNSRGRSRTRKRWARRWDSSGLAQDPSPRPGVSFHHQQRHSSDKGIEMSPWGSSNATKVEALPVQISVPFFFWKQSSVGGAFSSHDTPEQMLIKLLDQIDERISDDPIRRYYSKVPELTMDDVLSRQESLHEPDMEKNSRLAQDVSSQMNKSGIQGTIDLRTVNIFAFRSSENKAQTTNKGSDDSNVGSVEALSTNLDKDVTSATEGDGKHLLDDVLNSTNTSSGQRVHEETNFIQTQALGLISHDKALAKQLVGMSQQIIWSFIPKTGGSVIHTLLKRLWGCVDVMCLQLLWEESQRGRDSECTYIIRNFSSQIKKTDHRRRKPASEKIHYLVCGDCKAAKPYQSARDALNHLHEKHIDCQHNNFERPYDDPCYVWLHRIWHDGYPMRSSRDGLLGIMEDFIEELSYISNYVRELRHMTTRDASAGDAVSTPPLPGSITHAFQQIVKMFVFRSKQLSLLNRRRTLVGGSSLENFPLIQRIDRKIEELLCLEMDANDRIMNLLENAKKDIFLSGIGSHSDMLEAETVRVQFLALALMSGIQKPLLQPSFMGRSYRKDTLLQLYKDYTSRLHFQANNRPQKRVFLDIHGLEEELQALDKLLDSQESCLYNVLTLIDPLTSRYTTETRFREFRAEVQYGNVQLHQLIERRREIDNLATRLWILKDQVKQTIEIMEEDHGKAIRVFTVVTLFFLPLSFVSSFLGMNTVDVRDSEWSQGIFWITAVPITVAVLSLAFVYGYKGEEVRDWMVHLLYDRGHKYSSSALHDMNSRTSLETRLAEWNPAITVKPITPERSDFGSLLRRKIKNISPWKRNIKEHLKGADGFEGRILMRRRNTEDSLAPMRRS